MSRRRIIPYQQLEFSDCGITCIRIIARYFGKRIPLKVLRKLSDPGRIGISIRDILNCTREIGFKSSAVRVTAEELWRMPLPAILFWNQRHYVVLYKADRRKRKFHVADPAQGKVIYSETEFLDSWKGHNNTGIAIIMNPVPDFYIKSYPPETRIGKGLASMLRKAVTDNSRKFVSVLMLSIISMTADIAAPLIFQKTVDDGIAGKDISLVWLLVLGQLAFFIGNYIANYVIDILLTKVGLETGIRMVKEYLEKLIRLPMAFFDRKVSSDLIQKIDDQNRIKNFLVSIPDTMFLTALGLLVFSGILIYYDWIIFLIFAAGTGLSLLWTKLFLRRRRGLDYSEFTCASESRNCIYEMVYGMAEIKTGNAQDSRVETWNRLQEKLNKLTMSSSYLNLYIGAGTTFFGRFRDILITGLCATAVINGSMTLGIMMTVNYIVGRLSVPVSQLTGAVGSIQDAAMSYERLDEIMNRPEETHGAPDYRTSTVDPGSDIILKDVTFKYPGSYSPDIIKNISTVIPAGKVTAVVGPSGSGKTTLIKLMLAFYSPQHGSISAGKTDLNNLETSAWLSRCGAVMQSGYIFSGSVMENIALADQEPDMERVVKAARIACIDDFIATLPMGYNTRIGATGIELSGGQKQRLFIARAVYKDPQYVFLDEATSSLDANNEKMVISNLMEFYKGRTVVIAAHRLSTIKNSDKIIYIERGVIQEEGDHNELVARQGKYFQLMQNQLS